MAEKWRWKDFWGAQQAYKSSKRRPEDITSFVMWEMHLGKVLQLWDSDVLTERMKTSRKGILDTQLLNLTCLLS
jgi:hypothetical protein